MKTGITYGVIATTPTGFQIIHATWYTLPGGPNIGIVTGVSSNGERKSYIGTALGLDETRDALHIAVTGARFHPDVFRNFIS